MLYKAIFKTIASISIKSDTDLSCKALTKHLWSPQMTSVCLSFQEVDNTRDFNPGDCWMLVVWVFQYDHLPAQGWLSYARILHSSLTVPATLFVLILCPHKRRYMSAWLSSSHWLMFSYWHGVSNLYSYGLDTSYCLLDNTSVCHAWCLCPGVYKYTNAALIWLLFKSGCPVLAANKHSKGIPTHEIAWAR